MSKCRDLLEILFWLTMLIAGLLSRYNMRGYVAANDMELLVRKCENDIIFLTIENIAFNSASVESAAMNDWILVVQEMMTPLGKLLFDCIEQWSGKMLANAESEK